MIDLLPCPSQVASLIQGRGEKRTGKEIPDLPHVNMPRAIVTPKADNWQTTFIPLPHASLRQLWGSTVMLEAVCSLSSPIWPRWW